MQGSEEDKGKIYEKKDIIYEWAEENLMDFNEEVIEQIIHGTMKNISVTPYKGLTGKDIESEARFKDLGIVINEKLQDSSVEPSIE